jgi:protein O-GlcNAc transferase
MNDNERARELFFKGLACLEKRDFYNSEQLFYETLKFSPRNVPTLNNLAIAQYEQGKISDAALTAQKVIEIDPKNIDAYLTLSTCQKDQQLFEEVLKTCEKIISIDATIVEAHCNLGFALGKNKKYEEAIASFDCAIELNPRFADAFLNRGNALRNLKRYNEAFTAYEKALVLKPDLAEAWLGLANTHFVLKRYDEALADYEKALALKNDLIAACVGLGNVLGELQDYNEAFVAFDRALSLKPNAAEAWLGRGSTYFALKRYNEALAEYQKGLSINDDLAEGWLGLGNSYFELKRYDEALAAYNKALAVKADFTEGWLGRANLFSELRKHDEAAGDFAKVLDIDPSFPFAKGRLLHQKMLICDWHEVKSLIEEIEVDVASGKLSAEPFGWQGVAKSERSLQLCANLYNEREFPAHPKRHRETALVRKTEKMRVGYLSGEFREQPTSHLLVGVLENHDHSKFDIYAFDNGWDDKSEIRQRINASVPNIIDISRLSDLSARDVIGDNRIDILVNLNGYFGRSRNGVFAQRAAPIQVNYLGFPGTLGATYMDYIIADQHVIPENNKVFYNEKVVYLPNSYQANDQKKKIGSRVFSRAECGLPKIGFIFCCFNNSYKITPDIFDCWVRILKRIEGSVLWLLESNVTAAQNLRMEAKDRGINPDRLVFAKPLPLPDHLARLALADLCLDTLPYNAHTTASDALWVGLPVLTQIGETFAGRVGSSLLNAIDIPELVTNTEKAYEALAVELASNSDKRRAVKRKLVNRLFSTALFDTRLFTRHIEKAYSAMSDRFQKGLSPDHIWVSQ